MSCTDCASNEILYVGDGAQVLYTFPFTYYDTTDVYVELYNFTTRRWDATTEWTFANATTVQFNTAPPAPPSTDPNYPNIKIARCTDIDPLAATFYPGSAIRAQDLNNNFEMLQMAIQEGRCKVPDWLFDYLDKYYWNKLDETTYTTSTWATEATDDFIPTTGATQQELVQRWNKSSETTYTTSTWADETNDSFVPTTGAVNQQIETRVPTDDIVTLDEQINGNAEISDTAVFSSAAAAARFDNLVSDTTPPVVPVQQPGKIWNDTDNLSSFFWDPDTQTWVGWGQAGPPGPPGPFGPPGAVIVSDDPPIVYPASGDQAARALASGDLWFNSSVALLYVYYIDNTGPQWVSISITGPQGPQGPPGTGGGDSNLTFTAPLVENNDVVSINLNLINPTP